ncbi:MAG: ABC transporter permease, partial [Trueperaceae bacterium]
MADAAAPPAAPATVRRGNPTWRRLRRNKNVVFGTTIIALLVLVGPWITPMDPYAQDIWERYAAPRGLWVDGQWNTQFVLGADELGRDLLSRLIIGARVSLMVGLIATVISLVFGVFLGAVSGYVG